ncbi:MAG: Rha family transcriptional regulator [Deltaproteobacteria bacterium]|nr:Rha family transcriptional regulator [Deltaproteobacteria bacterium]
MMYQTVTSTALVPSNRPTSLVTLKKNVPTTTSLIIAQAFGKKHKNILQRIEKLLNGGGNEGFYRLNFQPVAYRDAKGENRPMYEISKTGFMVFVQKLAGPKAESIRIQFAQAFEAMERVITRRFTGDWRQARVEGKETRRELTDVVQRFIEYAKSQGSRNAGWYYCNLTRAAYRALFNWNRPIEGVRDSLSRSQLRLLDSAEMLIKDTLLRGMESGTHYKEVPDIVKGQLKRFADLMGRSEVPVLEDRRPHLRLLPPAIAAA